VEWYSSQAKSFVFNIAEVLQSILYSQAEA